MNPYAATLTLAVLFAVGEPVARAQDWPQWRGSNREARAEGFKVPAQWPKEMTRKWSVSVGEGVATPSLVGDRLYVFSRQEDQEVLRCLAVADGKELWQEKYESMGATGPAQSFSGPRSSPAVGEGMVVTLGVRGMISAVEAASGRKVWRKDEFRAYPNFHPSSSPLILNGLAIAQLGGRENGALVAYDLKTGEQKWRWSGPSPSYASPALMKVGSDTLIFTQTESKLVAVNARDGSLAWESETAAPGGPGGGPGGGGRGMGGRDYRASTPAIDGQTLILAGRGVKALRFAKEGDTFTAQEAWTSPDKTVSFNSPTLSGGRVFGLTGNNELFCLDARDGKVIWSAAFPSGEGSGEAGTGPRADVDPAAILGAAPRPTVFGQPAPGGPGRPDRPPGPGGPSGPGGPRGPGGPGGGRRGGGGGYGNLVAAGPVMFALTPAGQLVVFATDTPELKVLASYKVAAGQTHAYPVISGNRIFVKDGESVTLWTLD